jgi:hypothetical protein
VPLAELAARLNVSPEEYRALVDGLEPGYVERVGPRVRLGPFGRDLLGAFSLIEAGNGPLAPGDGGGPVRLRPGPAKGSRRPDAVAA